MADAEVAPERIIDDFATLSEKDINDGKIRELAQASQRVKSADALFTHIEKIRRKTKNYSVVVRDIATAIRPLVGYNRVAELFENWPLEAKPYVDLCLASIPLTSNKPSSQDIIRSAHTFVDATALRHDNVDLNSAFYFVSAWIETSGRSDWREAVYSREAESLLTKRCEALFVAAANPAYFFSLADVYIESLIQAGGQNCGVVFVLCDFDSEELSKAEEFLQPYSAQIQLGYTSIRRHVHIDTSFYCIARYYELSYIWSKLEHLIDKAIIPTDIDNLFKNDISNIILLSAETPLGYVVAERYLYPWQRYRANLLLFSLEEKFQSVSRKAVSLFDSFLQNSASAKNFWFVDQAAIAYVVLKLKDDANGLPELPSNMSKMFNHNCFQPTGGSKSHSWGDGRVDEDGVNKREKIKEFLKKHK